jgi:O-antigen/teichoic acid export membrane protein
MKALIKFFQAWMHQLLGEELDAKIRDYFLKGSFQSLFLQAGLSILTFLTTIVVARLTGDEGFGIYSLVFTWISVISVGAVMGLDDLALKLFPIYKAKNDHARIKGLFNWTQKYAIVFSLLITALYLGLVNFTKIPGLYNYAVYHNWAALSIPFFVLMHLHQASLRGLAKLGQGQWAEKIVQPLFFLLLLLIAYIIGATVSDKEAIIFRAISFVVAAIVALILTYRYLSKILKGVKSILPDARKNLKSCFFFMLSSLLYMLNTRMDILFLGVFEVPVEQIAYYNVALKFSDIALIPFLVICTVTTPMFSSLFHQGKLKELQHFYTKTTRLTAVLITVILLIFVAFGPWFLSWYGSSFTSGYSVLLLLSAAKFIHVFMGPVAYLLAMTEQEKAVSFALIISVSLTIILQIILIPIYEIEGAAWASLIGLIIFEIILAWLAYKRTGIIVSAIGNFGPK